MKKAQSKDPNERLSRFYSVYGRCLAIAAAFALLAAVMAFFYPFLAAGKRQPIPFSHRVHVEQKGLSCFFCHSDALVAANAGLPPLETCMLCHEKIIIHFPPIEDLRWHYADKVPVEWIRVVDVPDYVYFTHQLHLRQGIDCGSCHGNVRQMDRVFMPHAMTMGFCFECHRSMGASVDCFTCHR